MRFNFHLGKIVENWFTRIIIPNFGEMGFYKILQIFVNIKHI